MLGKPPHIQAITRMKQWVNPGGSGGNAGPPKPVADFSVDDTTIDTATTATFTDLSTNTPTSWLWEKNDGSGWVNFTSTSANQNPTQTFTAGTWSIRLTATNAGGSSTPVAKTDYVVVTAAGAFTLGFGFLGGPFEIATDGNASGVSVGVTGSGQNGIAGKVSASGKGGFGAGFAQTTGLSLVSGDICTISINTAGGGYTYFYRPPTGNDPDDRMVVSGQTAMAGVAQKTGGDGGNAGVGGGGGGGEAASAAANGSKGSNGGVSLGGAGGTGTSGADGGAGGDLGNNAGVAGVAPGGGGGGGGISASNPSGGAGGTGSITISGTSLGSTGYGFTCPNLIVAITNSGGKALVTTMGNHGQSGTKNVSINGTSVAGYNTTGTATFPTATTALTSLVYSSSVSGVVCGSITFT